MAEFLVGSPPSDGDEGDGDEGDGDEGHDDSGNGTGGDTISGGMLEGQDLLSGLGGPRRSSESGDDVSVDPSVVFEPNDEPVIAEQIDPIAAGGDDLVDNLG